MNAYTIRNATEAFAALDATPADQTAMLDKSLRNLSQRYYLPTMGRETRADTFAAHSICALRLVHRAALFGLDRWQIEGFARWMQIEPTGPTRRLAVPGGFRPLARIEEACHRVKEGESFGFALIKYSDLSLGFSADWATANAEAVEAVFSSGSQKVEDARLSFPASRQIAEVLHELGA